MNDISGKISSLLKKAASKVCRQPKKISKHKLYTKVVWDEAARRYKRVLIEEPPKGSSYWR